jgi:hypothetical protein
MTPITPDTTIGALLDAYPDLESVLIDVAPAFAKLRNPVVRRTVAKVATLEQAAKIGGADLHGLICKLRDAAGQRELPAQQSGQDAGGDAVWLTKARVVEEIDADAMLEGGVHPIGRVREAVRALGPGEAILLRSSFRPQPLIEIMRGAGAAVYGSTDRESHVTWFGTTPGSAATPSCEAL